MNAATQESDTVVEFLSPTEAYYHAKLEKDLQAFYNFAIQSRSVVVRDVFAKHATKRQYNFPEFLSLIETLSETAVVSPEIQNAVSNFDPEVLLVLAALLSNTARDDLDTHASVQIYNFVYKFFSGTAFSRQHRLQYVETLLDSSQYDEFERRVEELEVSAFDPLQVELLNLERSGRVPSSDEDWLNSLNEIYSSRGMSTIELVGDDTLPLLDRLKSGGGTPIDGPKVSVIMPTYSPGLGIRTAVRSLLEQTWRNLEIIIVDDASPDECQSIFEELEALDSRISVIRQEENAGAYVARNAGLEAANGEFITIHDDDDWSHPDKIAEQVALLDQDDSVVASVSAHIRTTPDMRFQRINKSPTYTQMNYSSLLFRKELVEQIGGWDTVTRSGDTEFFVRIIANFGSSRILELKDKPVAFSRVWAGSLTSGEMWRGFYSPARLLYRGAFRQWHRQTVNHDGKVVLRNDTSRPFPTPTTFAPGQLKKDLGLFDVIYVTDYFTHSKTSGVVVEEIETLVAAGFRVGYTHLPSPESGKPIGLLPKALLDLQLEGKVTQVSHDDVAATKLLIVYDASIGMYLDEIRSTISSQRSIIVYHQQPVLEGAEERSPVLMRQAVAHLDECFATSFMAVGVTPYDHKRLSHQVPAERLLTDSLIWHRHLTAEAGEVKPPQIVPKVGFHSYGNQFRWPSTQGTFEAVYISPEFKTRLYGNVKPIVQKFGQEALDSVEAVRTKDLNEAEFLQSIDFWVYFPHPRLRDQMWPPVLSAMQAGKVVILPRRLEQLYGSAALYVDAEAIGPLVSRLSKDEDAYCEQALRGQEFVAARHSPDILLSRIATLIDDQRPVV